MDKLPVNGHICQLADIREGVCCLMESHQAAKSNCEDSFTGADFVDSETLARPAADRATNELHTPTQSTILTSCHVET